MGKLNVQIIPVTPFQQNCALLWDDESKKAAIVDPGGDLPKILQAIAQAGVTVEAIFITHGHLDHAGAAADLAAALNIPIFGPDRRDQPLIADLAAQGAGFGMQSKPFTPQHWLEEGETIAIGGHEFAVLHCPGHTPGHLVFVNHAEQFAIVGDVLFRNSVGRTDFPYGDHAALIAAITEKLLPLGDDFVFICGHGVGSTFGAERRSNPFLQ
jgi:glyoxylase-like metal-dependent hydrolase (beta-lactamase superfamily II)